MKMQKGYIYSFYIREEKKFTAFQVIIAHKEKNTSTLLAIDYYEDVPLPENELWDIKPFVYNHHNHKGDNLQYFEVEGDVPMEYVYIGQSDLITEVEVVPSQPPTWFPFLHIPSQKRWLQLPKEHRERYKAVGSSSSTVYIGGTELKESSFTINNKVMEDIKSGAELDLLPKLTELYFKQPTDWLMDYLKQRPQIELLGWNNHLKSTIDVRDTGILTLKLDTTNLRDLYVGKCKKLEISGEIDDQLKIHLESDNYLYSLTMWECNPTQALKHLQIRELTLINLFEIDIEQISTLFPNIEKLKIVGKPTIIANMRTMCKFDKLEEIDINEAYGFTPLEFPTPNQMPRLKYLWMSGIPTKSGNSIKELYAQQNIHLDISKLRNEKWIEENINNPFRHWYGEEHISDNEAKKASDAYAKFSRELKKLAITGEIGINKFIERMVKDYVSTFNKMNNIQWISTTDAEDIYDAFGILINLAKTLYSNDIDKDILYRIFEENREF